MANEAELASKLKMLALTMRLGHDLAAAQSLQEAASMAVNNPQSMLQYKSASLFLCKSGKPELLAQYGQVSKDEESRISRAQGRWLCGLDIKDEPYIAEDSEALPEELRGNKYCVIRLKAPNKCTSAFFLWVTVFETGIPTGFANAARLIGSSMADSLFFQLQVRKSHGHVMGKAVKLLFWLLVLSACVYAMFIKVPESAKGDFVLVPGKIDSAYAWFDGPIAQCLRQNGEIVRQGEVIAVYDTSQLDYKLALAESALLETETELEIERRGALTSPERQVKAKLLEARLENLRVNVRECKWFIEHAQIKAPSSGVLVLADGRAEQLTGRAVRIGEHLFDIYGNAGVTADIFVNERDSSILSSTPSVVLFLHTMPDVSIEAEVIEVMQYPELTEQRTFCYRIRCSLGEGDGYRYGMRGVARLRGKEVTIGYQLFKNAILYFRRW